LDPLRDAFNSTSSSPGALVPETSSPVSGKMEPRPVASPQAVDSSRLWRNWSWPDWGGETPHCV
jgi:hypothetical protein